MTSLLTGARVTIVLALTVLSGLVLAALVPLALGYSAHVVTSGSMAPRVGMGDVVVTQPVTAAELHPGQVVLVHDPQVAGGLLLHRLVSLDAEGRLVTRGDANQSEDSVHADPADVRGLAVLRVPWVGLPALWRADARYPAIALAAVALVAGAVFAGRGWGERAVVALGPARGRHRRPGRAARTGSPPTPAAGSLPVPSRPPVLEPVLGPAHVRGGSRSTPGAVLSMTETVRPAAPVRSFARPIVTTNEGEEEHRAPSTRGPLPPVPPAVRRPDHDRSAAVRPAGPRVGTDPDHGGCINGCLCGRPRR